MSLPRLGPRRRERAKQWTTFFRPGRSGNKRTMIESRSRLPVEASSGRGPIRGQTTRRCDSDRSKRKPLNRSEGEMEVSRGDLRVTIDGPAAQPARIRAPKTRRKPLEKHETGSGPPAGPPRGEAASERRPARKSASGSHLCGQAIEIKRNLVRESREMPLNPLKRNGRCPKTAAARRPRRLA